MKSQRSFSNSQRRRQQQRQTHKSIHRRSDIFSQQHLCDKKEH